jgi:hypothetical protein
MKQIALLLIGSSFAFAQGVTSSLTGTVLDPSDRPVAGATAKLTGKASPVTMTSVSNDAGLFRFQALPTGVYTLVVERDGFKQYRLEDFELVSGQEVARSIKLELGTVAEGITVVGELPEIQRVAANGVRGASYNPFEVENIPMLTGTQGRSFRALSYQIPGVGFSRSAHAPFTVNGNRPIGAVNTMVDQAEYNDPVAGNLLGRGVTEQPVSMETVEAFEMQTSNFKAEFGRASGAVVNLVTKQGGNAWRGSIYHLFQNDFFNARNTTIPVKTPLKLNMPGFTLGGPLRKDKLFFFTGYEVNVRNDYRSSSTIVTLTEAERARAVPAVRPLLALYPLPNIPGTNLNSANIPSPTTTTTGIARLDYQFNERHRLGGRVNRVNAIGPTYARLGAGYGDQENRSMSGVLSLDSSLSHRFFNQARATYSSYYARVEPFFPSLGDRAVNGQVGTVIVTGLPALGTFIPPTRTRFHNYTASNDFTYSTGRHVIKTGGIFRDIQYNSVSDRNFNGTLVFPAIQLLLIGQPAVYSRATGNSRIDQRNTEWGWYAQDDWRIRPSLTLNLGVRYEYYGVPGEKFNRLTQRYASDGNNLAPRLGFAWDVAGRNTTIVRGGYGLFFSPLQMDFIAQSRYAPPLVSTFTRPAPRFPDLLAGAFPSSDAYVVDRALRNPYVQNWNLTIERQLWNKASVLSLAYVGNRGLALPRTTRPNLGDNLAPGTPRPDSTRGVVSYLTAGASSNYHSLQANFRTAMGRRLSFRGAYTFSKAIDIASDSGFLPVDERNWRLDRAVSDTNQPHLLTTYAVYSLPFFEKNKWLGGWQVVGLLFARSGTPFSLLSNTVNPFGTINNRINNVPGTIDRTRRGSQWFSLAPGATPAAVQPAPGTIGTLGRNTERESKFVDFSLALHKDFVVTERVRAEFRAEAFNALNRVNWNAPIATLANPALFGRILNASDPRQFQLMLKLLF